MKGLFKVKIDMALCKKCGICIHICGNNVFLIDDVIKIRSGACSGCGICEIICPDLAISVEKKDERTDRR